MVKAVAITLNGEAQQFLSLLLLQCMRVPFRHLVDRSCSAECIASHDRDV
jgi:hypothetical protein